MFTARRIEFLRNHVGFKPRERAFMMIFQHGRSVGHRRNIRIGRGSNCEMANCVLAHGLASRSSRPSASRARFPSPTWPGRILRLCARLATSVRIALTLGLFDNSTCTRCNDGLVRLATKSSRLTTSRVVGQNNWTSLHVDWFTLTAVVNYYRTTVNYFRLLHVSFS